MPPPRVGLKLPHTGLNRVRQPGGGVSIWEGDQIAWVSKPWLLNLAQPWEKAPWWGAVNLVAYTTHLSRIQVHVPGRGLPDGSNGSQARAQI